MILKHCKVPTDLMKGKKVLDIGCGRRKLPGAVGLDFMELPGVDIIADLNERLPIDDEEFDCIHASHVLEHVDKLIELVYEIHRILKPGGIFLSHTPYFRSAAAYTDPTHVRFFAIKSMDYFVKGTYFYKRFRFREQGFQELKIFLDTSYPSRLPRQFFTNFALDYPRLFEDSFLSAIYPFHEISYLLTK